MRKLLFIITLLCACGGEKEQLFKAEQSPNEQGSQVGYEDGRFKVQDLPDGDESSDLNIDCGRVETHTFDDGRDVQLESNSRGFVALIRNRWNQQTDRVGERLISFSNHGVIHFEKELEFTSLKDNVTGPHSLHSLGEFYGISDFASHSFVFAKSTLKLLSESGLDNGYIYPGQFSWARGGIIAGFQLYSVINREYPDIIAGSLDLEERQIVDRRIVWNTGVWDEERPTVHYLIDMLEGNDGSNYFLVATDERINLDENIIKVWLLHEEHGYVTSSAIAELHLDRPFELYHNPPIGRLQVLGENELLLNWQTYHRNFAAKISNGYNGVAVREVHRLPDGVVDLAVFRNQIIVVQNTATSNANAVGDYIGDVIVHRYDSSFSERGSFTLASHVCTMGSAPIIRTSGNTIGVAFHTEGEPPFLEGSYCVGSPKVHINFGYCSLSSILGALF